MSDVEVQHFQVPFTPNWVLFRFWKEECIADDWTPVTVRAVNRRKALSDFPHLMLNIPVFSRKAHDALMPHLGSSVEALPLVHPREECEIFAIHVLAQVNCLDRTRSRLKYDVATENVDYIEHYAFVPLTKEPPLMFCLPETRGTEVLVTQRFVDLAASEGLHGASFETLP